jgi:riboflavin synthase
MFTGIVEEVGEALQVIERPESIRLTLSSLRCAEAIQVGDSLAVNGCCLTVVRIKERIPGTALEFDLLRETWNRTNLRFIKIGSRVNLERSVRADGRIHGHFVTGHIDGTGKIESLEKFGGDWKLVIATVPEILRYVVPKGSIAVDGISLTVAEMAGETFVLWIIPHTREVTTLAHRRAGDFVNLEADLLAKYVEKLRSNIT